VDPARNHYWSPVSVVRGASIMKSHHITLHTSPVFSSKKKKKEKNQPTLLEHRNTAMFNTERKQWKFES